MKKISKKEARLCDAKAAGLDKFSMEMLLKETEEGLKQAGDINKVM